MSASRSNAFSASETNFQFTPIDSKMWEAGYPRYLVRVYATSEFVGEVHLFRPRIESATPKWLAFGVDGFLRGSNGHLSTRQAAAEALLAEAGV